MHTGDDVPAAEYAELLVEHARRCATLLADLGVRRDARPACASAVEFVLEGLHLSKRLNKDAARRPRHLPRPGIASSGRPPGSCVAESRARRLRAVVGRDFVQGVVLATGSDGCGARGRRSVSVGRRSSAAGSDRQVADAQPQPRTRCPARPATGDGQQADRADARGATVTCSAPPEQRRCAKARAAG